MPIDLTIPSVGESITEVQIGEWLKAEGDTVKQDEPLAVIDSEKTTFELPAPQSGTLTKILHQAGETVPVGAAVAQFEPDGKTKKSDSSAAPQKSAEPSEKKGPAEKTTQTAQKSAQRSEQIVSDLGEKRSQSSAPSAEALASDKRAADTGKAPKAEDAKSVDLEKAGGAASSSAASSTAAKKETAGRPSPYAAISAGKIARPSPESGTVSEAPPPERNEEVVPMTMLRRTAARRLVEAQNNMAMLTTFNEADMSAIQLLRKEYQEEFEKRHRVKLGLMSFFIKATVDALRQFPKLNAEIRSNDIIYRKYFDIGVAVASERGLVVPVLRQAEHMSFAELEKAIGDFANRARDGLLKPAELDGGTFTITNGGVFGSLLSTPIINPPQSGILGLHSIQERPVAVQGQVVIRPMMYLALTYDHRLVDGREAVLFLRRVKQSIEAPARLLVEV